jgi:hypothetical protein
MTLTAVIDRMALCQRKACMVKNGGFPPRHGGVALHTNIANSGCDVVGIGGGIVIGLMARETLCRCTGIIGASMTLITVKNSMSQGKGKKGMIKSGFSPGK